MGDAGPWDAASNAEAVVLAALAAIYVLIG
jgi:hypothetical protein